MTDFPPKLQKLIRELTRLPAIGEKSATRLAYHLISVDREVGKNLAGSIIEAIQGIQLCTDCFFISENEKCTVCQNPSRDRSVICVVEKPMDVIAIERVGEFRGMYHVLHGIWAPLKGKGPESMKLDELMERLKPGEVKEVILATSSTVEGDATSLYIAQKLAPLGIRSTRLAQGMPKGGELEYADDVTLSRAFSGRSQVLVGA